MEIFGGLRRDELVKLNVDDVDDRGAVVVVKIRDTKTGDPEFYDYRRRRDERFKFLAKLYLIAAEDNKRTTLFLGIS
jgi:integrase